jgi:hypothetical protein
VRDPTLEGSAFPVSIPAAAFPAAGFWQFRVAMIPEKIITDSSGTSQPKRSHSVIRISKNLLLPELALEYLGLDVISISKRSESIHHPFLSSPENPLKCPPKM